MTAELSEERARAVLTNGSIEVVGLMPGASNYTFAVRVALEGFETLAVYKPQRGEQPLWDFPEGTLYRREIAAYELSAALGWGLVPLTIARDGPYGIGSLQLFIDFDPQEHYLTMMPHRAADFVPIAIFDLIANNADRKSGHCLLERGTNRIFAIDHGVCFHDEPKLRTVIWDFAGEPIAGDHRADIERVLASDPPFMELLSAAEAAATRARAKELLAAGVLPEPPDDRRSFPWPPV